MRGKMGVLFLIIHVITVSWDILGVFFFFGPPCIFFEAFR
jgi:hypothetical protein